MSETTPPTGTGTETSGPGSLTGFILYSLKLGHTLQGIRSTLIKSGLDMNVIDRSLRKHSKSATPSAGAAPTSAAPRPLSAGISITTTPHLSEEFARMMDSDVKVELEIPKQELKPKPKVSEPMRLELRPPKPANQPEPEPGILTRFLSVLGIRRKSR